MSIALVDHIFCPEASSPACCKGGSCGREFGEIRDLDRCLCHVCLELHEIGILRDAAICSQGCESKAGIGPQGIEHICYLVGDALGAGLCDLCPAGECCDTGEHARGGTVPQGAPRPVKAGTK